MLTTKKNKQIETFINNSDFIRHQTEATFLMNSNTDSTPDVVLYSRTLSDVVSEAHLSPDLCSDHLSIVLTLKLNKSQCNANDKTNMDLRKTNTDEVNKDIKVFISSKRNNELNIEDVNDFQKMLEDSIIKNTPRTKYRPYLYKLPKYILHLIKNKRRMYREYMENKNVNLKKQMNALNKNIQYMVMQYRTHHWLNVCKEIEKDRGKTFWQKIKKVSKYKERGTHVRGEETAKTFAAHYKKAFSPSSHPKFDINTQAEVTKWYATYFNQSATEDNGQVEAITEEEYYETLVQTKNTAPGPDNITGFLLKQLEPQVHEFIVRLYNVCLKHNYVPIKWKLGFIIPTPKPNQDLSKPENHRPITLLSVLGKNLEKIIKKRLWEHVKEAVPQHQFGFKPNNSTIHPLYILTNNIQTAHIQRRHTAALFLDINKAFDSVWHAGLLFKLFQLKTPDYLINFVNNFLTDRVLKVKIMDALSEAFTAVQGVPQGSPLSPVLYNIYCHDIFDRQHAENTRTEPKPPDKYMLQYADDTTLIVHDKKLDDTINTLQTITDQTMTWFYKWRLIPNPNKCQLLIPFYKIGHNPPSITVDTQHIRPQHDVKYLGMIVDSKCKFKKHLQKSKSEAIRRAKYFRNLTFGKHGISTKTATKIYKAICRPILDYGHIIMTSLTKTATSTTKTAETSSLRAITKIRHPNNPLHNPPNNLLYERTAVEPVTERHNRLKKKFTNNDTNWDIMDGLCLNLDPNRLDNKTNLQDFYKKLRDKTN